MESYFVSSLETNFSLKSAELAGLLVLVYCGDSCAGTLSVHSTSYQTARDDKRFQAYVASWNPTVAEDENHCRPPRVMQKDRSFDFSQQHLTGNGEFLGDPSHHLLGSIGHGAHFVQGMFQRLVLRLVLRGGRTAKFEDGFKVVTIHSSFGT